MMITGYIRPNEKRSMNTAANSGSMARSFGSISIGSRYDAGDHVDGIPCFRAAWVSVWQRVPQQRGAAPPPHYVVATWSSPCPHERATVGERCNASGSAVVDPSADGSLQSRYGLYLPISAL